MQTIYSFIKDQEIAYSKPITLEDGWNWSMKDHLRRSFLYKNSQFEEQNENRELRPNKNIVLGIRNVENRTEGFDVKDVELYINNAEEYYKSFMVKKFHDKWALENQIDTFIDDIVDSYGDYGGTLTRNTNSGRPEVIDLRSLAFCNQTSILDYPFAIKHRLSPAELRAYGDNNGWGEESKGATIGVEDLIQLCKDEKDIVVYELHGHCPKEWLKDGDKSEESKADAQQINIVAYYKKSEGDEQGVTLFRSKEPKLPFKFLQRDKIVGRALGRGGIEELFDSQIWTNWNEVKVTEMLEAASKIVNLTDDPAVRSKHPTGLKNVGMNEIIDVTEGKKGIWQMDNSPRNLTLFNDSLERWNSHAQVLASTTNLTEPPQTSNMPFKLYEAQNIEDKSMHKFRQGQIAVFLEEIYREWIIPHIGNEIVKDQNFLAELSADEMQKIAESVVGNEANKMIKSKILNGELVDQQQIEIFKQTTAKNFLKDNKKFFKILKGEMKKEHLDIMTNIAGKQKNLAMMTDKIVNVLRQYIDMRSKGVDTTGLDPILNNILESSGMSPVMFSYPKQPVAQPQAQPNMQPMQQLSQLNQASATAI